MSTIPSEKQMLRRAVQDALREMTDAERAEKSCRIARYLGAVSGPVFGFAPLRFEPNWWEGCVHQSIALPRVDGSNLVFHWCPWPPGGVAPPGLIRGAFGAREPSPDAPVAPLGEAATILVPGLAFDATGGRLGRGAGFYDRLLADPALRAARRVGVGFARQVLDGSVPVEPHDVALDAIVTENGWIEARSSGRGRV